VGTPRLVRPNQVGVKAVIAVGGGSHLSGTMQACNGHGMHNQRTKVGKILDIRKKNGMLTGKFSMMFGC
jgi:lipoprotein